MNHNFLVDDPKVDVALTPIAIPRLHFFRERSLKCLSHFTFVNLVDLSNDFTLGHNALQNVSGRSLGMHKAANSIKEKISTVLDKQNSVL